jgi:hypothetical protein
VPTRLLLIADDGFDTPDALPEGLHDAVADADHVHVVAPVIGSRLDTLTEDESIYEDARARAERIVQGVREHGTDADADHSESAPLETAIAELQAGDYDGVIVGVTGEGHWREEGLLEQLRERAEVPVHEVTLGG